MLYKRLTAKIIPIFKFGDSNSTVNYLPLSMLPFLSKIFEKLMCARLDFYPKSNNILCTNQFSKAFDIVNHNILMSKILHNGVSGVMQHWFESYFSNMRQYVPIKNCSSTISNIKLGVPQGLVLGPVHFLLYINDVYRSSSQMRFVHFADDTTVFASDSDINNVHANVNRELVSVDNWLKAIRLSLNVSKNYYILISN